MPPNNEPSPECHRESHTASKINTHVLQVPPTPQSDSWLCEVRVSSEDHLARRMECVWLSPTSAAL